MTRALALLAVLCATPAAAQGTGAALRVFLDCPGGCDFDHLRAETPWVAYVRDRTDADVHVLVTRLGTGAGGDEYTITLLGQAAFRALGDTLRFVSAPGQAEAVVRDGLTRTIQLGLVPFALRTPAAARLRVELVDDERAPAAGVPARDPWRSWVFSVGVDGSLEREEQQSDSEIDGEFSATRITPAWKFGIQAEGEFSRSRFEIDDDRTATRTFEEYGGGAVAVRSLGPHWGAGVQAAVSSSTFENTRLAVRAAPAVEYSVWPYDEATRRQLTLQYSAGVSAFDYREVTIFGRLSETRPTHAFVAGYDVRQPWGSANAQLETASFLDDFAQYRVAFDGGLSLRLLRGLSLEVGGSASLIRDQLALARRDATPEEILLELRALRTDYRYDAFVGVRYTFGSIFNSVVNPRFGTGPGEILR